MTTTTSNSTASKVAYIKGYRSGLEDTVSKQLETQGLPVVYEQFHIPWVLHRDCKYTPDFLLPNGIIIETKGHFDTDDRQKHRAIRKQYPDLDIRFVFSRTGTRIGKRSKTTYAKWCERFGFQYAARSIPEEWLSETLDRAALDALRAVISAQNTELLKCLS